MRKKDPKEQPSSAGTARADLTHNPFAALLGQSAVVPSPAPAAAEVPPSTPTSAPPTPQKSRGRLLQRRETKHRGGKAVVVVTGFASVRDFTRKDVDELAAALKRGLGCGGTVEEERGELRIELLRAKNFRVDGVTS
jgi:translation initiation factor 1 (eIF-1/SUI1)